MNRERAQTLFEAIGGVREEFAEETQAALQRRRRPGLRRAAVLAACLLLVLTASAIVRNLGLVGFPIYFPFPGGSTGGSGGQSGTSYMSYMGPVFPLSAQGGGGGLTVSRSTDFGFSNPRDRQLECRITDEYVLTNPGATAETVTLLYPFAASLADEAKLYPALRIDGEALEPELLAGAVTDGVGTVGPVRSWEDYRELLGEGMPLPGLRDQSLAELPVTVYEICDMYGGEDIAHHATLNLEFDADWSRTAILTYRFNGGSTDLEGGLGARHTDVMTELSGWGDRAFLLVLGEDIENCEMKAYTSAAMDSPAENAGGTLRRYTSTLGEMTAVALDAELSLFMSQNADGNPYLSREQLLDLALARMEELGLRSESIGSFPWGSEGFLEDIFGVVLHHRRLMYFRLPLTVPAGASVTVTAEYLKQPSIDYGGREAYRQGYDLVTKLGTELAFTRQEASLSGGEKLEILDQNFGFDLQKGITRVTLDPAKEHYFMDVRMKA